MQNLKYKTALKNFAADSNVNVNYRVYATQKHVNLAK